MQRQRGELVPIGDALSGMGGPVAAIRDATPQALHHFTRFDQVNQLVSASEADPELGFLARTMALCSLPRTNPGNRKEYKRVNGPFTLYMVAGGGNKLPYGNLPRLLIAWLCTEAVRTQSPDLVLGSSLSEFMRKLGIHTQSGGRGGMRTLIRNQMRRLFGCSVTLIYEDEQVSTSVNSHIAERTEFWWNERKPDQPVLWDSKIRLGWGFFQEVIEHPVPLDMNTLKALKTLRPGPRSVPLADLPHLYAEAPGKDHLAAGVPPVRSGPGQGRGQRLRASLPPQGFTRVEKDQAGLAEVELHHGAGRPDPSSLDPGHCAG